MPITGPARATWAILTLGVAAACGGGSAGPDGGEGTGDGGPSCDTATTCEAEGAQCGAIHDGCGGVLLCGTCGGNQVCGAGGDRNLCGEDMLSTATGCAGVFNPDQVLDFHITMTAGDWSALKADTTNSVYFPASFACGDEAALPFDVGVRRKRSGSTDKPGLKVDINLYLADGRFQDLRKLSLENGVSEGSSEAELKDPLAEYMAWRVMGRAGAISGRAVFARVLVNGDLIGTYVNVEQIDKRFLGSRIGENDGWLYKHSGGARDGYKTNETTPNPYEERMCFWDKNPCNAPSAAELETLLPMILDIDQMLRFGGANAIIGNSDGPMVKDNNFYFYDGATGAPRLYIPWDLDTAWRETPPLFGGTGTSMYTDVLFTHWEDDYDQLLTELLAGPLTVATIEDELDRVVTVAASALDADPVFIGSSTADAAADLESWWSARHAQLTGELDSH